MAKFNLVSDQTNVLNERKVIYQCDNCGHVLSSKEFPYKFLPPTKEQPCLGCEIDEEDSSQH